MSPAEMNLWHDYLRRNPPLSETLPSQMAILLAKLDCIFGGTFDPDLYLPGAKSKRVKDIKKRAETKVNPRKKELQIESHKRAAAIAADRLLERLVKDAA